MKFGMLRELDELSHLKKAASKCDHSIPSSWSRSNMSMFRRVDLEQILTGALHFDVVSDR